MKIITGLILLTTLVFAWIELGLMQYRAEAKIEIPDAVTVMEKGDKVYRFEVVPTQGHGRRIWCEGLALGPKWGPLEGLPRSSRSVVFPQTHSGNITITISHDG